MTPFCRTHCSIMCYTVHNTAYRTGVHDCIVLNCYHGYHGKHRCTLVIPWYSGVYHFTPTPKNMIYFIWYAMVFLTWVYAVIITIRPDGVGRACPDMSDEMTPISHFCKRSWMHLFLGHCGLILQLAPYNWVNFGDPLPLNGGGSGGKAIGTIDLIEVYWPALMCIGYTSKLGR